MASFVWDEYNKKTDLSKYKWSVQCDQFTTIDGETAHKYTRPIFLYVSMHGICALGLHKVKCCYSSTFMFIFNLSEQKAHVFGSTWWMAMKESPKDAVGYLSHGIWSNV